MSDQKPKGNSPNKKAGAPFTGQPGSGKGHNFPQPGTPNSKGWSEKAGKGAKPKEK